MSGIVRTWNTARLPKKEDGRQWAVEQGLIPTKPPSCRVHRIAMHLYLDGQNGLGRFKCTKKGCNNQKAVAKDTWFEHSHLKPHQIARLMYAFARNWPYEDAKNEGADLTLPAEEVTILGQDTIAAWMSGIVATWNTARLPKKEDGRQWAVEQGLIPTKPPSCRVHRIAMHLYLDGQNGLGRFKCTKKGCNNQKAVAKDTWFEHSHLKPHQIARLMYAFARNWPYEDAKNEGADLTLPAEEVTILGQDTIAAWFRYCREMVVDHFIATQTGMKLGPDNIVQIYTGIFPFNDENGVPKDVPTTSDLTIGIEKLIKEGNNHPDTATPTAYDTNYVQTSSTAPTDIIALPEIKIKRG
ncbi:hypothetical protein FQR65_LT15372 [Abscondita terminalis]|nr:hypothetical protein FQR65_LT15372 [Abscondita terminalis]